MTLQRVWIPSPNVSGRGGEQVRLIVLHTSEGAQDYQSLGSWFAQESAQVSSHVGIDDTPNTVGEYVHRGDKAWTSCNANPAAVQAELCTPSGAAAGWTLDTWHQHSTMLQNTAAWIAEEAAAFGIPIVKLSPAQAQGGSAGVCQHSDLGSWGCGHYDCGDAFPIDEVLSMAVGGKAPAPAPTPSPSPAPRPGAAPPFPYPSSDYLGQPSPDDHCHSGCYGGVDSENVATWQSQMIARGWSGIGAIDGCYGPACESVCLQFQAEKQLSSIDGLVGPETWAASWNEPVT